MIVLSLPVLQRHRNPMLDGQQKAVVKVQRELRVAVLVTADVKGEKMEKVLLEEKEEEEEASVSWRIHMSLMT